MTTSLAQELLSDARLCKREWLLVALSTALALFLLVMWAPTFMGTRGDTGFTYMAHYHFARGIPWGTETLHTTGPWAMVRFAHYYPPTYWITVACHVASALWIGPFLGVTAARHLRPSWLGVGFVGLTLWLFFLSDDSRWFFILLSFVLVIPDFSERRSSLPLLVGCLFLGFVFHVKGTFLLATFVLAAFVAALELYARRVPIHALFIVGAVLLFNELAGSDIGYIPGYIRFVLGGVEGNPENFSHLGPLYQPLVMLSLVAIFMLLVLGVEWRMRRGVGLMFFVVYGMLCWTVYRTGFARHDTVHASRSFFTLIPFVFCYLAIHLSEIRHWLGERWSTKQIAWAGGALACGYAVVLGFFLAGYLREHDQHGRLLSQARAIVTLLSEGLGEYDEKHERAMRRVRSHYPLPEELDGSGPVGVYGQLQTPVLAHGYENVPFPVVAAYENWNPWTVKKTIAFLKSERAPEYILMTYTGHSSETLRVMSERYRMIRKYPLVLKKRDEPLNIRFVEMMRTKARWHQRVEVPEGHGQDILRLKMRYRRTWFNRLVTSVYQPVPAYVVLYTNGLVMGRIRIDRMLAAEGLTLATFLYENWDARSQRVHRIRHRLFPDILRANRRPLTSYALELMPGIVRKWAAYPRERSWLFPGSDWRWYYEPEIDLVLERAEWPGRKKPGGPQQAAVSGDGF